MFKTKKEPVDHTSIKLRAYPNPLLREYISKSIGHNRFIWNWALGLKKSQYERRILKGKPKDFNWLSYNRLSVKLPKMKEDNPWLKEVSSQSLQQTLRHLNTAFDRWFKGTSEYPVFKPRSNAGSFHLSNNSVKDSQVRTDGSWLYVQLPLIKSELKCKLHRSLPEGRLLKTVVSKNSSNQYFVSLMYEVEYWSLLKQSSHQMKPKCGIDLGVKQPLTISWVSANDTYKTIVVGRDVKTQLTQLETKRKRYQKQYARKLESKKARQKLILPNTDTSEIERVTTKNLDKAVLKVAKVWQKESNVRSNFAHKISKELATRFEVIKFENLGMVNMTKRVKKNEDCSPRKSVKAKSGLNRELLRLGLGSIVALTQYKSKIYGSTVLFVNPCFTSQRCSDCGFIHKDNRTSQSKFECQSCGFTLNADTNASINILTRKPLEPVRRPLH